MTISEIEAKTVLRRLKRVDPWFVARYGMNLYRGCAHNCAYCDGRAEGYYVAGEFGRDVAVKVNAVDVLHRELDPKRKRVPLKPGYVMLGGGVGDSYQPAEREYLLSRRALEVIHEYGYPVHVLTKSTLVTRDVDILKEIDQRRRAIVSFSFSSVDDGISRIFEPGVPPPSARLDALSFLKGEGLACGMFLMPVIPLVTDTAEHMEKSIRKASELGLDFVIFGGMTLKEGRQKDHFMGLAREHYPEIIDTYDTMYAGDKWGQAPTRYYDSLNRAFGSIAGSYRMPVRIPPALWDDILDENDRVIVILGHIDYLLRLEDRESPFGYASYSVSQVKEPLSEMKRQLRSLKGVGRTVEPTILEILETGRSSCYERLMGLSMPNGRQAH